MLATELSFPQTALTDEQTVWTDGDKAAAGQKPAATTALTVYRLQPAKSAPNLVINAGDARSNSCQLPL